MKLTKAIEGGLAGASTLSLLQEALHKIDGSAPRPFLHQSGILKKLKKQKHKNKPIGSKLFIQLASELMGNAAYFGLTGVGKKKNAVLRGGLLGAAAGLGAAFFQHEGKKDFISKEDQPREQAEELKRKLLTVALYTSGGLLAGAAIKNMHKKSWKKKKNK